MVCCTIKVLFMTSASSSTATTDLTILCPHCRKPNPRRQDRLRTARFCQHCGRDVVLNNDGPRYYITKVIKEGGQGAVYQAIDDSMKIYAVKEMLDRFFDPKEREEAITRFETEARMLQSFNHPRIPRVYADFKDDERHYLVMDFVRGEDLEDIAKRDGRIAEAQVLIWADQICDVLELLHRQDPPIIFRDMKPSNIMIEREGNGVKLIDFGIAKVFAPSVRGTQIGTPGYAPPEQYQGIAAVESDIYALGATLHHLLTGRDPRDFPTEMFKFPPVRTLNPAVSERTAQAIERAVQTKMEDRFRSIAEFRAALRTAPAVQPQPQPQQPVRRKTQPIPAMPLPPAPAAKQAPVAVARPAVQAAPQAQQTTVAAAPKPAAKAAPQPKRNWRGQIIGFVFALIVIGLIAATVVALPGVTADLLPRIQNTTPTVQISSIAQFTMTDEVVMVPDGQDVRTVVTARFLELAKAQHGPNTVIVQNGTLGYIGDPVEIGVVEGGKQYRASMQGYVSFPR
jgi:eukaryotic-like serine/threonine-protein kinase